MVLSTCPNVPSGHLQSRYDDALWLILGKGHAVLAFAWHWKLSGHCAHTTSAFAAHRILAYLAFGQIVHWTHCVAAAAVW